MLGKTLKYEFGATARIFLPLYAVLLVMSCIARLFYLNSASNSVPMVLITMFMVMLFTAVWVVTIVIIVKRFWTNLLGREGYLMHTLPVKTWQHVFAKILTSTVWCILGVIFSVLAIFIMLSGTVFGMDIEWASFADAINQVMAYVNQNGLLGQGILLAVQSILMALFSFLCFTVTIYASMAIGQLVNRHRIWASIGAYFGINIVISLLSSLVNFSGNVFETRIGAVQNAQDAISLLSTINLAAFVLLLESVVLTAALFFVTSYILRKKLNLQ